MTQQEFIAELEEILSLDAGELSPDSNLKEIEDWDSLAIISVIALIDKKIGKKIDVQSIKECVTVSDLLGAAGV